VASGPRLTPSFSFLVPPFDAYDTTQVEAVELFLGGFCSDVRFPPDPRAAQLLVPLIIAHLEELCPHCAQELSRAGLALDRAKSPPVDYEPSIRAALEAVEAEVLEKPVDSRSTGRLMALLGLPECDRCAEVRQEPAIYGRLELAERLLMACRAKLPGHPREILALTTLARCILRHTPDGPAPKPQIAKETYALAMAHHGNALKVLGQLETAAHLFSDARVKELGLG